jgi:hypothetical protein
MSLKIAVLSSLTALSAFRAPAPAGDQAQNLAPPRSQEPRPTTISDALIFPAKGATAEPQAEETKRA